MVSHLSLCEHVSLPHCGDADEGNYRQPVRPGEGHSRSREDAAAAAKSSALPPTWTRVFAAESALSVYCWKSSTNT